MPVSLLTENVGRIRTQLFQSCFCSWLMIYFPVKDIVSQRGLRFSKQGKAKFWGIAIHDLWWYFPPPRIPQDDNSRANKEETIQ